MVRFGRAGNVMRFGKLRKFFKKINFPKKQTKKF
jgi:hypothetical protein